MGLIDPKKLTDETVAGIFAKVRKTYANDPGEVVRWIQENLVKPDVKVSGETKKGLIEFFDQSRESGKYVPLLSNCMGAFLKLEPMELVELAKKDPGYQHGQALATLMQQRQYIEYIHKDKKAFQALMNIIIDQIKSGDSYRIDNYLSMLNVPKDSLSNQFDPKEWLPDGFLDEIAIKHGAKSIKRFDYEPPETIQLKMVEKDHRNIEHMPYATNKVKERARMFERAQKDRGRYSGR
jgi:hypothetical protein